ncbi:MAG: hypothetical protein WCK54_15965 [Desulfuromonadales bacterium]
MTNEQFDPIKELQEVKIRRKMMKRKFFRKSKLEKYRAELVAMKQSGASPQDLAEWLKMKHRLKIHRSSVDRYLSKLPELAEIKSAVPPGQESLRVMAVNEELPPIKEVD